MVRGVFKNEAVWEKGTGVQRNEKRTPCCAALYCVAECCSVAVLQCVCVCVCVCVCMYILHTLIFVLSSPSFIPPPFFHLLSSRSSSPSTAATP